MAVFTALERGDFARLLLNYDLGVVDDFEGISSGIENTNYFVWVRGADATDTRRKVVLTLFERLSAAQLPFYLALMRHLAGRGVPCPAPFLTHQGALFSEINGKPAAFVECLPGRDVADPSAAHCALVGDALARAHQAGQSFPLVQPNLRGLSWWKEAVPSIVPHVSAAIGDLLQQELAAQITFSETSLYQGLPRGPVHADLFRDNVLFASDPITGDPALGGLIDFYFAGVDTWLFDLAVVVNDWTIAPQDGLAPRPEGPGLVRFDRYRTEALLGAYARHHRFSEPERVAWPWMLRAAAYRFWVSRLFDWYLPRPAEMLTPKDPRHFEQILRNRVSEHHSAPPLP
ncbi:MAG: homoserine kinase [Burkholderiaceae bacterium]